MSVSKKFRLIFSMLTLLTFIVGATSVFQLRNVAQDTNDIYNNYLTSLVNLSKMDHALQEVLIFQKSHIIEQDDDKARSYEKAILKDLNKLETAMKAFAVTLDEGLETDTYNEFKAIIDELIKINDNILENSRENNDDVADDLSNHKYQPLHMKAEDLLGVMTQTNIDGSAESFHHSERTYVTSIVIIFVLTLIFVGSIIFIMLYIRKNLTTPLQQATAGIQELANQNNNVTLDVDENREDEIGDLAKAFNSLLKTSKQLDALKEEDEKQRIAAQERSNNVNALTQDFDLDVRGVIEAVSAAANEMESSAYAMSEQVTKSSDVAEEAKNKAITTSNEVNNLVLAASKIESVVTMISDVAEKTNLLALNASIESARAGEAGKGFAVVADEVKKLATETVSATEEISKEVAGIQTATKESEQAIQEILEVIDRINEISASVEVSVKEQGTATTDLAEQATILSESVDSFITNIKSE